MTRKKITPDGEIVDEQDAVNYNTVEGYCPINWKTPWNHDTNLESNKGALVCLDPSRTQQQFAADADINNILAKFRETGQLPVTGPAQYLDIEEMRDLQDTIVTASQVDAAWNELSSEVRNTLKDPATFASYVEHCLETGDLDPLRKLGLAKPLPPQDKPQEPTSTAVVSPVAPVVTPPVKTAEKAS